MIYYLLANNYEIQDYHINQIKIDNSTLILFNYMFPIKKFERVKNHPNKYLFCRLVGDYEDKNENKAPYAGLELLSSYKDLFQKIYIYPCPDYLEKEKFNNYKEYLLKSHINSDLLECIEDKIGDLKKISRYPRYKNMSTGFVVYNYIKQFKSEQDSIVLVGFTSDINQNYHHRSWEAKFFRNQIQNKICEIIW